MAKVITKSLASAEEGAKMRALEDERQKLARSLYKEIRKRSKEAIDRQAAETAEQIHREIQANVGPNHEVKVDYKIF